MGENYPVAAAAATQWGGVEGLRGWKLVDTVGGEVVEVRDTVQCNASNLSFLDPVDQLSYLANFATSNKCLNQVCMKGVGKYMG